jgi:hypothetical protein
MQDHQLTKLFTDRAQKGQVPSMKKSSTRAGELKKSEGKSSPVGQQLTPGLQKNRKHR